MERTRPESRESRESRMTPSSSNSSTANLPRSNTGARAASGASLLQERLRERKTESARQDRTRSVDLGRERVLSSPVKEKLAREERRPSSSMGMSGGKGMGVKQIEEQVSTLHKQNFDLKLELYHRRQRQETLEAKLDAMEKEIAEQRELQEVNEQLLAELEKRDQAVEEAVGIIVGLEDKVERLMRERETVRLFDAQDNGDYFRNNHDMSSSPPAAETRMKDGLRSVARMPSFLSEQSEGAEALRSLYLPHSYTESTLPRLPEETPTSAPDSPRLSVLSESSFLSVYGDKGYALAASEGEEDYTPQRTHRKSSSVENWIDERPASTTTPLKSVRDGIRKNGFLSINDVLESPLQRLEKLKHTLELHTNDLANVIPESSTTEKRRGFTDKSSFENQQLPPTPDTISTSTLRHYQYSTDTLADSASDEKFLNTTPTFPVPIPNHNAHQSLLSVRPRSADETITSRRDGHGWDTETATSTTSLLSSSPSSTLPSLPTSNLNYASKLQHKRIVEPDLFSFNDLNNSPPTTRDWGHDMLFNSHTPASTTAKRYGRLRRASLVEPRSDDTVVPGGRSRYVSEMPPTHDRPILPDRRSSLSQTKDKFRNSVPTANPTALASSPATKDSRETPKKGKLAMPKFFSRAESTTCANSPSSTVANPATSIPRVRMGRLGGDAVGDEDVAGDRMAGGGGERERATPPPIKRNRTMPAVPLYRPGSAGIDSKVAAHSAGLEEGQTQEDVGKNAGGGGGRKWGVFGRSGSLRR